MDGQWVEPTGAFDLLDVVDPSTENAFCTVALGTTADAQRAVAAARAAFDGLALPPGERLDYLRAILSIYERRAGDLAAAISSEMGAPTKMALHHQVGSGAAHLRTIIETLRDFAFDRMIGTTLVTREAVGVVAMITPWNWPLNQIACKVGPALAAGCSMVLKPSEIAPLSALVFAEIVDEAGLPSGVFNLVNGTGPVVGAALASHPDVDMVSITGSNRAGVQVARDAAETVKRVHQELGGKSANIILDDGDFETDVRLGALKCFSNSGQSCNAPTRMLVPAQRMDEAAEAAAQAAHSLLVGPARGPDVDIGPVVSEAQFDRIQDYMATAVREGARLVAGGPGRPDGLARGYFVRPTVFADVTPSMRIAREEIFGPVLSIIGFRDEDEAVQIANDSPYGLAAYISSGNLERARRIARRLRVGNVHINHPAWDTYAPFGGYKQSGNGREYGEFGLNDFLETKGVIGYGS